MYGSSWSGFSGQIFVDFLLLNELREAATVSYFNFILIFNFNGIFKGPVLQSWAPSYL